MPGQMDSNLDLELKILVGELSEDREGLERRRHTLTEHDGEWFINVAKLITREAIARQGCSIGLTDQQMSAIKDIPPTTFRNLKEMEKERRRVLNALGVMTLAVLGWAGKWIFEKIDWPYIWRIVTHGGGK